MERKERLASDDSSVFLAGLVYAYVLFCGYLYCFCVSLISVFRQFLDQGSCACAFDLFM